jgi:hypothetical protein
VVKCVNILELLCLKYGRRSEIHSLSVSDSCFRFNRDQSAVILLTDPSFLGKNQIPSKGSKPEWYAGSIVLHSHLEMDFDDKSEIPLCKGKNSLELELDLLCLLLSKYIFNILIEHSRSLKHMRWEPFLRLGLFLVQLLWQKFCRQVFGDVRTLSLIITCNQGRRLKWAGPIIYSGKYLLMQTNFTSKI